MEFIRNLISMSKKEEDGATAVEYGIMVALIAAVIVLVVLYLGQQVQQGFCDTSAGLEEGGITAGTGSTADC